MKRVKESPMGFGTIVSRKKGEWLFRQGVKGKEKATHRRNTFKIVRMGIQARNMGKRRGHSPQKYLMQEKIKKKTTNNGKPHYWIKNDMENLSTLEKYIMKRERNVTKSTRVLATLKIVSRKKGTCIFQAEAKGKRKGHSSQKYLM